MSISLGEFPCSIKPVCEDSLLVEWSLGLNEPANPELTANISAITQYLLEHHSGEVINVTPAYRTVLIQYDILKTDEEQITRYVAQGLDQKVNVDVVAGALRRIPVFYDPLVADDLEKVCAAKGLMRDQLIALHTSIIYDVYAVGFLPGFAYLGYVPEQLNCTRHESFRGTVPAGSVAIADRQTAVYPAESPGGWQVIGRTPKQMLENQQSVLQVGGRVQFCSIGRDEFLDLGGVL